MKHLWRLWRVLLMTTLMALGGSRLYAQSIAEAATKERARRERQSPPAKVLTEADLAAASSRARPSGAWASRTGAEPGKDGEIRIPFTLIGNSMIVTGEVNNKASARFIIDTGASLTCLSAAIAESAGITISAGTIRLPMQTANGPTLAPRVKLHALKLGALTLNELDVVVLSNWPDTTVSGLLGMNVLNRFHWSIDRTANQLVLKPYDHPPDQELFGGHDRDWWSQQFRHLRASLDHWQSRQEQATRPAEVEKTRSLVESLEAQMTALRDEANRAAVPLEWRR